MTIHYAPADQTSDALSDELTVIAMAKMLDDPHATGLDRHIERVWLWSGHGISASVSAPLDAKAVCYANHRRRMDERELIEVGIIHRLDPKNVLPQRITACGIKCWPTGWSGEFDTEDSSRIDAFEAPAMITCRRRLGVLRKRNNRKDRPNV